MLDKLTPQEKQRLEVALNVLAADNANWINNLEALAKMKVSKPFIFQMALKKLGNG